MGRGQAAGGGGMMIDVLLTKHESRICTWTGKQRDADAHAHNRDPGLGPGNDGPECHIRGAHGEFATSIGCNLYWRPSIGLIHEKDVGGKIQTRCIDNPTYSLVVKPKDPDADPFVLVLQLSQLRYRLLGWRFGYEVKRDYPLRTDRRDPAHYCPQGDLYDMDLLLEWIATRRRAAAA
jgi:hypothetical protein